MEQNKMDQRYNKLKSQKKMRVENVTKGRKNKSNIQVAAVQSRENGTESITVSYRGSSKEFQENDMKDPRTAKMFFKCVKMKINKNDKDTNKKIKIMDALQNKIQKLEVAIKRLDAKSRITVASEVKSEKPEGARYSKRKIVKRSKKKSAAGTRTAIPHIKSGEFEFIAERTASPIAEENNEIIISDLNANKHLMKKRTAKSTVSRSTCEVKSENANYLEDEKRSYSMPNELGIRITDVWSLDKETESDKPATLEQSNEIMKTENAAVLSKNVKTAKPLHLNTVPTSKAECASVKAVLRKRSSSEKKVYVKKVENVTMVKPLHSSRVTASEAEYEAIEAILRKWTSSEKRVGTKSLTKYRSRKSLDKVYSNFKKNKKKLPTVYAREQVCNSVLPITYTGYSGYLNTSPNIPLGYPSYINLPYNIQMGNPACTIMFPTVAQVFYPAFPVVQMGSICYPGRPSILRSSGEIPASNLLFTG